MRIAIAGAGIAGPTLAYWLLQGGHEPVLIEQAPALRAGGYMIDFWGRGYDIAERMGLLPRVRAAGYDVSEVRFVDAAGRRTGGFSADVFRRALDGRFVSLPRGDLAALLHGALAGRVETIFGDMIVALEDGPSAIEATLLRAGARTFDLVIGADGLHSGVRGLVLGPRARFERPLGYHVAAFVSPGYEVRDERAYVSYARAGRQVSRFALRGDRTMFLLVAASDRLGATPPATTAAAKAALRAAFTGGGWETGAILDLMDAAPDLYFDGVSQVVSPRWTCGRVALIGDAASCISLLGGEGSGLAMLQAYVLAGELARAPPAQALSAYEARLRPFLARKQQGARAFAGAFAPRTAPGVWLRDQVTRLMGIPWIADAVLGRDLRDDIELPRYGWEPG